MQADRGWPLSMQAPLQRPATVLARPGPVLASLREHLRPALVAESESSHSSLDGPDQPGAAESLSTKQVSEGGMALQSTGSRLNESWVDPLAKPLTAGHCYRWGLQNASRPLGMLQPVHTHAETAFEEILEPVHLQSVP